MEGDVHEFRIHADVIWYDVEGFTVNLHICRGECWCWTIWSDGTCVAGEHHSGWTRDDAQEAVTAFLEDPVNGYLFERSSQK